MSEATGDDAAGRRLTVLSGPSGVGKSSVVDEVRAHHPQVWVSVSVTTRAPRPGEQPGVVYHFVDEDRFRQMVDGGELLEHARYAGSWYGTPAAPLREQLAAGRPVLLEVELQGARQVRRRMPAARLVFLAPPSWEELERRLSGRGTEDPAAVRRRLDRARIELAAEDEFDAVLVNSSVGETAARLVALMTI